MPSQLAPEKDRDFDSAATAGNLDVYIVIHFFDTFIDQNWRTVRPRTAARRVGPRPRRSRRHPRTATRYLDTGCADIVYCFTRPHPGHGRPALRRGPGSMARHV